MSKKIKLSEEELKIAIKEIEKLIVVFTMSIIITKFYLLNLIYIS